MPQTKAPSNDPKSNVAKKPGAESNATVCIGLGGCMNAPATERADKIEMRAIRNVLGGFGFIESSSSLKSFLNSLIPCNIKKPISTL